MSVFIVAEMAASHGGSLKKALDIVRAAADSGADAIKLQTFEPKNLAVNKKITSGPWRGKNLVDLYKEAHTPKLWHRDIFDLAYARDIVPFSTPFHLDDLDFLESLDCPLYKISSFDIINLPLIRSVSYTGKPLIMSTGMASRIEISEAVKAYRNNSLTLLHCISAYPAKAEDYNMLTMKELEKFSPSIGLSDHTTNHQAAVIATYMGASVIEKHIALDKDNVDGKFSCLPNQFEMMVRAVRSAEKKLGEPFLGVRDSELDSFKLRPSLHFSTDMREGQTIERDNIKLCRPNDGLHPSQLNKILGRKLICDVKKDSPIV